MNEDEWCANTGGGSPTRKRGKRRSGSEEFSDV